MTRWCSQCQNGSTVALTEKCCWCSNCGCLFNEDGQLKATPSKIGPDPVERREAWDAYAAGYCERDGAMISGSLDASSYADLLLAERDKRFGVAK